MAERYSLLPVVTGNPYPQNTARHAAYEAGRASIAANVILEGITRDDTVHGETYFTAADMASAAAQGFRDGVASVAASAGSEPVAWTGGEEWEQLAWHLCAEEHGEDACDEVIWEGGPIPEPWGARWMKYESDAKRMIELVRRFYTHPSPPEGMVGGWISVEDARKPPPGKPVVLWAWAERYQEDDDGRQIAQDASGLHLGEWRETEHGNYFDNYSTPFADREAVLWWMDPAQPTNPAGSGKGD